MLPEELTGVFFETDQAAQVHVSRIPINPASTVVGADVNLTVGHDRVAVGLRTESRNPVDVLARTLDPLAGLVVELPDIPAGHNTLGFGRIITLGSSTPLSPILRAHLYGGVDVHRRSLSQLVRNLLGNRLFYRRGLGGSVGCWSCEFRLGNEFVHGSNRLDTGHRCRSDGVLPGAAALPAGVQAMPLTPAAASNARVSCLS